MQVVQSVARFRGAGGAFRLVNMRSGHAQVERARRCTRFGIAKGECERLHARS